MTHQQICAALETLCDERAAMERQFPPEWTRDQWFDDPAYSKLCFEIINLKAALGFRPFGSVGKKGGRK